MSLLLKNARVMDPASGLDGRRDVLITGGKIAAIEPMIPENTFPGTKSEGEDSSFPQDGVIDCAGKVLVPGLVDMHCHLREPGFEYKETIESGSMAGVAGGFGLVTAPANAAAVDAVPADRRGVAGGLVILARLMGLAVGLSGLTAWAIFRDTPRARSSSVASPSTWAASTSSQLPSMSCPKET